MEYNMIRFLKSPGLPVILACAFLQTSTTLRARSPDDAVALFGDSVVATGKGFEIKRSQLDDAFINYNANVVASGRSIPDQQRAMVRSNLLNRLVINKILIQKATEDEKSVAMKQVDETLAQARSNAPSPAAFDEQIKATGMTLTQVRDKMEEEKLCNGILEHELTNGIVIPDAEVKKFYDDNPDKFKMPERVRAAHILVSTLDPVTHQPVAPDAKKEKLKLANELKARAEKGEDFAALVKEYRMIPVPRAKGASTRFHEAKWCPNLRLPPFP